MRQRHISMRLDVQRRLVLAAAAAGLSLPQQPALAQELSSKRVTWGPFKGMSDAELARLDELSKATNIGVMLAGSSGVRVIDLVWGDGPEPGAGQRVFAHYKIWADGFRSGPVAHSHEPAPWAACNAPGSPARITWAGGRRLELAMLDRLASHRYGTDCRAQLLVAIVAMVGDDVVDVRVVGVEENKLAVAHDLLAQLGNQ